MAMHQITDKVFLGSQYALGGVKTLRKYNITHILSTLDIPAIGQNLLRFKDEIETTFTHRYIEIQDTEEEDIVQYFEETNRFIDEAIASGGGVLVHCIAGISRSASCVCAYLMKENKWTVEEALEFVRSKRPIACPNPSFMEQLNVYYACGYDIKDKKPYREWKLKHQAANFSSQAVDASTVKYTQVQMPPVVITWRHILAALAGGPQAASQISGLKIDGKPFAVTEAISKTLGSPDSKVVLIGKNEIEIPTEKLKSVLSQLSTRTVVLRCKGCSTTVADSGSFLVHKPKESAENAKFRHPTLSPCQHHFLEPVEWMRPELEKGEIEGRLSCPKCNHKLGAYYWQGSKCSCGEWITPAIKLQKSKVDEMATRSKPAL